MTSAREPPHVNLEDGARTAAEAYRRSRPFFEALADSLRSILQQSLGAAGIKLASIEARAKSVESFEEKASLPSLTDATEPRYPNPIQDITDLAAARVITFFPRTISEVEEVIKRQFLVHERLDKGDALTEPERFGYKSIHYVVSLSPGRYALPEYSQFRDQQVEIQVRTILQHAWAEIEHDIQYKSEATIPNSIRRRFMALAGLLEIADREFQAVQEEDENQRVAARQAVELGNLESVSITPDAVKTYLDRQLGPDRRMSSWSYDWTARMLLGLGFTTLAQVRDVIVSYDDDYLSRAVYSSRMGQLTRFELQLLAAFGETFIERHPWSEYDWFRTGATDRLDALRRAGIEVGTYLPPNSTSPGA